jgi:hypothetical protein
VLQGVAETNEQPVIMQNNMLKLVCAGVVGKALRYWSEGPGIDPGGVTWEIFSYIRQIHVPEVDSAS